MSVRDREVLELLRDEPELLAIADSVAETVAPRHIRPGRPLLAVALVATALFALVLASPWDRGGGGGGVLGRALGAIDSEGPILHLTTRAELTPGGRRFAPIVSERFYDKERHLVRVVSRIDDKVEADYTTTAVEDAFSIPGLLDQADFYRKALASGRAKLVGKGEWQGNTVYWLELQKGGGFILRVGVDRDTYRPVVFQALNPDRTSSGFQLAVLGFEYVSPGQASLDPRAPILATGKVIGPDCRPLQARVEASLSSEPELGEERVTVGQAVAHSAPDGTFTLRANPEKPPFREARLRQSILNLDLSAIAGKKAPAYIGFFGFTRTARDGRWWDYETKKPASSAPITLRMLAKSAPGRICKR